MTSLKFKNGALSATRVKKIDSFFVYGHKKKNNRYGFDYIRTKWTKKTVDTPYQYIEDDE